MEESPRKEWEPLVGQLVLACGDIELFLLQLYWNLTLHGQYDENIKYKGLGEKAKFIRDEVDFESVGSKLEESIKTTLEKTINLAHMRNLVAHNPLYMDVYSDEEGNFKLVPSIRSLRNNEKHISFEGLVKLNGRASTLSVELSKLVVTVGEAACPVA